MSKEKRQLYMDVAVHANAPLSERKAVVAGRNGERKIPRRYHLMAEELVLVNKEIQESGRFKSPYGAGRIYTYIIEALVILGVNKAHAFNEVYEKFIELASDAKTLDKDNKTLWERFDKKETRNVSTGRDACGKFMQNLEVLQRLGGDHPYALKLSQVGACIDILVDANHQIRVQLRTNIPYGTAVKPINMNRKRNYTKTVDSLPSGLIIENGLSKGKAEEE